MRRFGPLALVGLLVLLVLSARGHGTARCAAGTATVRVAGRPVVVHVPAAPNRTLLVALHGYRGSGPRMERYTSFDALADRDRFSVAYPSAAGTFWNSNGVPGLPDDVGYLSRLVRDLGARLCGHPDRAFLAGVSNGGGMAAFAACRLAARVTGFASVAGGYDGQPPCHPARPLPMLEIHGTADRVVPYFGAGRRRTASGLPPFVDGWLARDGCAASPDRSRLSRRAHRLRWTRCSRGVVVEHIRVTGGRHGWPEASPPDPGPDAGFSASDELARFLTALPARR